MSATAGGAAAVAPEALASAIRAVARGRVAVDEPLAPLTSFRLGGRAAVLVEPADEDDLAAVARAIAAASVERPAPDVLVLGRGSNLLVSDEGFPGIVVRLGAGFERIRLAGDGVVDAGGGAPLPKVANYAARRALAGMEFAVAIPATVGGAVRMNAGAHGSSVADVLGVARVLRVTTGLDQRLSPDDLNLDYRSSVLSPVDVVLSASFVLGPGDPGAIAQRMEAYRAHRARTQPSEAPNAGSMFRNPPGTSAGRLIERAGLKGTRCGGAEVSQLHANFFLAHPGATAQDVHDLMVRVQHAVEEAAGVLLVPEIRLVGRFERADALRRRP